MGSIHNFQDPCAPSQVYGYQTIKQNLQAHTYTQSNQPSN